MEERTIKIITTKDGSSSLLIEEMNETYHSTHGAVTESNYVFIEHGLDLYLKNQAIDEITIVEVGFGTGLNALLAWKYAEEYQQKVKFITIEAYPLSFEVAQQLFFDVSVHDQETPLLSLHQVDWGKEVQMSPFFKIEKVKSKLEDWDSKGVSAEVVFFDAFAPSKQSELWEADIFSKLYVILSNNGVLSSYCASGVFKRGMLQAGFKVSKHPGPPGKREMMRGVKIVNS